jgi:HrpA-like RNA helicase
MELVKESLPIYKYKEELMTLIRNNQIIIMVG